MDAKTTIEMKTKDICDTLESVVKCFKAYIDKGVESVDTTEAGLVADIIKDLSESYCNVAKAIYHSEITKAMSESEYGVDYDEKGRKYYGNHKDTPTRNMMPVEYYRDIDMDSRNRMYYTEPTMHDSRMGRGGNSRVKYFETKANKSGNMSVDNRNKMDKLEEYMDDIHDDIEEMLVGESSEIKTLAKQKLTSMANSF